MTQSYRMPPVKMGDAVLFSTDMQNFSKPTLGWIVAPPGDSTVSILTFTPTGFVERSSVHHRSDPNVPFNPGWAELGVWDYAEATRSINKIMEALEGPPKPSQPQKVNSGREVAGK